MKFCIVIPVFRHLEPLAGVLASLDPIGLPCLLVDDGNPRPLSEMLSETLSALPWVKVKRLPTNSGKGAASIVGFRWAAEEGYSHVIMIDADGQHNVQDIPRFMDLSRSNPKAQILGKPIFDMKAPWGRRWGRLLTTCWTWIETLSFEIGDSLFGFRCYPVAPVMGLLAQAPIGQRMDFDPDIVVRLYWAGVPVINFETPVQYPPSGFSNFRLWQDNGALSFLHTRLFFGMLRRWMSGEIRFGGHRGNDHIPVWRNVRERGAMTGMLLTAWVYRHLGRRFAEIILWFVVTYFFFTSRKARHASKDFLSRIPAFRGKGAKAPFWDFALTSLDRFDVWTGATEKYRYSFKGKEHLDRLVSAGKGAVLFGAHFGNSDVLRALTDPSKAKVHFLTDQRGSRKFYSVLRKFCPRMLEGVHEYDAHHPENILSLQGAVARGEFVGLLADRMVSETARGARRVIRVPFLGQPAAFPQAPFLFAATMKCPVLFIAGLRRAPWDYDLIVDPLFDRIDLPEAGGREREKCLENYVAVFAKKLESYCVQYPTQWFNFFDFWRE